jgi:dephospho-CoA kinase
VAVVIPLLYEIRDEGNWDVVVCVAAPEADQRRRLAGRGLTDAEASVRIRAQWAQMAKMEHSDYVIYNCGSATLLKEQTERVMRSIRGEHHDG